ncbi:MAG: metallophosphoesterase family protein [Ignavibacteriae bacterium]|nr:metallophosphoesterase family protein [Ignavibacteriota bacterium]MCB9260689.1 metallophosphoesterase family protein [Ignavibacteriales bacterium]
MTNNFNSLIKLKAILIIILTQNIFASGSDKYRIVWNKDPETCVTIGWDQVQGENPIVYFGDEDFGDDWEKYPRSQMPTRILADSYGMNTHFAEIENLKPDQSYYFVIKDSKGVGERYWFKTAPSKPQPFSFITGGDTKSYGKAHKAGEASNRLVAKLRPLFVLFNGDFNSGNGTYSVRWHIWLNDWFEQTTTEDGRMIPLVPVHGNHEDGDLAVLNKIFNAPYQNNDSSNIYYSLTFGNNFFHIVGLNTQIDEGGQQRKWLENDLSKNKDVKFKIAGYHKPFHPHTASKSENVYQYQQWTKLFYDYKLSLAVEADAHIHKITYPLIPDSSENSFEGFVRDDKNGTIYLGEGSWGAWPRENNDLKPWTLSSGSYNQFKWVHVYPENMEIYTVKSAEYDDNDNQTFFDYSVESLTEENLFKIPNNITLDTLKDKSIFVRYPFQENK